MGQETFKERGILIVSAGSAEALKWDVQMAVGLDVIVIDSHARNYDFSIAPKQLPMPNLIGHGIFGGKRRKHAYKPKKSKYQKRKLKARIQKKSRRQNRN